MGGSRFNSVTTINSVDVYGKTTREQWPNLMCGSRWKRYVGITCIDCAGEGVFITPAVKNKRAIQLRVAHGFAGNNSMLNRGFGVEECIKCIYSWLCLVY